MAFSLNEGREKVGHIARRIGANPNPASLKFSGKEPYEV
jgi:photosystem I subunit 2